MNSKKYCQNKTQPLNHSNLRWLSYVRSETLFLYYNPRLIHSKNKGNPCSGAIGLKKS